MKYRFTIQYYEFVLLLDSQTTDDINSCILIYNRRIRIGESKGRDPKKIAKNNNKPHYAVQHATEHK